MIQNCREIIVKAVRFPHQSGSVFYACLPCDAKPGADHQARRTADQIHLVSILLGPLAGMDGSSGTNSRFSDRAKESIQIVHDPLGRPQLLLGECEGPAISFSEGGGKRWAALCQDAAGIGIDAAETADFPTGYPFHRVFHAQELGHALRLTGGDWKRASALLWSIKEAAVKALGCGFHLVDPLHLCVDSSIAETDGRHFFTVRLSGKALARFPIPAGLWVHSLFQESMWLSIALLNRQQVKTERP
jgi:phosphopantetheinyl transferase (holo-ACP synthase)